MIKDYFLDITNDCYVDEVIILEQLLKDIRNSEKVQCNGEEK